MKTLSIIALFVGLCSLIGAMAIAEIQIETQKNKTLYCETKDGIEQPIANFKEEYVIPPSETSLFCKIKIKK